jgi:hypothetical protein
MGRDATKLLQRNCVPGSDSVHRRQPQHRLCFLPEPLGHGSLHPALGNARPKARDTLSSGRRSEWRLAQCRVFFDGVREHNRT